MSIFLLQTSRVPLPPPPQSPARLVATVVKPRNAKMSIPPPFVGVERDFLLFFSQSFPITWSFFSSTISLSILTRGWIRGVFPSRGTTFPPAGAGNFFFFPQILGGSGPSLLPVSRVKKKGRCKIPPLKKQKNFPPEVKRNRPSPSFPLSVSVPEERRSEKMVPPSSNKSLRFSHSSSFFSLSPFQNPIPPHDDSKIKGPFSLLAADAIFPPPSFPLLLLCKLKRDGPIRVGKEVLPLLCSKEVIKHCQISLRLTPFPSLREIGRATPLNPKQSRDSFSPREGNVASSSQI